MLLDVFFSGQLRTLAQWLNASLLGKTFANLFFCGGLGIKNLHLQNKCLLMKFSVKALLPTPTPWLDWLSLEHPNALLGPSNHNIFLCKTINSQLPTLHSIFFLCSQTIVLLLFFWLDTWLTTKPLCLSFPCLFSHSVEPFARVANIIRFGLNFNLRDRLTLAASTELVSLLSLLQDFMLSNEQDQRFLKGGLDFSTKRAYEILSQEPQDDLHAKLIWKSRVPSKIKVFAWLVFKGRLNTKAKLAHKSITPNADCPRCSFNHEDMDHLLIACPLAARIWQRLRIQVLANNTSLL